MKNGSFHFSWFIGLLLLVFLSSCKVNNEVPELTTEQELDLIVKRGELSVNDLMTYYSLSTQSLQTYTYKFDDTTSYVNISEYIDMFDELFVNFSVVEAEGGIELSYTVNVPKEYQTIYENDKLSYQMVFDADQNVVIASDFEWIINSDLIESIDYETDMMLIDLEFIEEASLITIDLNDYGFEIVTFNGEFYIPLYLANLFFGGSQFNVYEYQDHLLVFDNGTELYDITRHFRSELDEPLDALEKHTKNYLSLYFDYFYGLKNYKAIESYKETIDDLKLAITDDVDTYFNRLARFLNSQNDLHTSLVTAGRLARKFTPTTASGNKQRRLERSYLEQSCYLRSNEIDTGTINDLFIIQINAFSLDTKDLIQDVMHEGRYYEDILIDLSCNLGGNVVAVLEVLAYMTDEPIELSYKDTITGAYTIETYLFNNVDALDANFYVLTSGATYSAANLFASLARDHELAVLIGEDTNGGASSIRYTVLPDGAIIVNSSPLTFVNGEGEVIEDGIPVDFPIKSGNDYYLIYNELNHLFEKYFVNWSVERSETIDKIEYHWEYEKRVDDVEIQPITVNLYNYLTNELIASYELEEGPFTIQKDPSIIAYKLEWVTTYSYKGITQQVYLFEDIVDDHGDEMNEQATEITIEDRITGTFYSDDDRDVFKFTITEPKLIRIKINNGHLRLFKSNGELVNGFTDYDLEAGHYYLELSPLFSSKVYEFSFIELYDDNKTHTEIELMEGTQHHPVYYDYDDDSESFMIHVNKKSLVHISWEMASIEDTYVFTIYNEHMKLLHTFSAAIQMQDGKYTVVFPPGTYFIYPYVSDYVGEVVMVTETITEFDDYDEHYTDEFGHYGELTLGSNDAHFIAKMERDVYYFDVTEASNYWFTYGDGRVYYYASEEHLMYLRSEQTIFLDEGRHYFVLENFRLDGGQPFEPEYKQFHLHKLEEFSY